MQQQKAERRGRKMNPYDIEGIMREKLGEMYGTHFRKGKLLLGNKLKGESQVHEFDLISDDNGTVGEVKSGKSSRTNYSLALVDCFYLSKIKARIKLMVFTNRELYEYFKSHSEGLIEGDIQAILVSLDHHLETMLPRQ
jgi:hypothetical protein